MLLSPLWAENQKSPRPCRVTDLQEFRFSAAARSGRSSRPCFAHDQTHYSFSAPDCEYQNQNNVKAQNAVQNRRRQHRETSAARRRLISVRRRPVPLEKRSACLVLLLYISVPQSATGKLDRPFFPDSITKTGEVLRKISGKMTEALPPPSAGQHPDFADNASAGRGRKTVPLRLPARADGAAVSVDHTAA